eukprot:Phypoly_transcript_20015.p1 GENE.Phypoly_transcript_20015~~Phypoly_transcript_20015.p1  ORF type:complete len:188 (+),score=37.40 Phypoly_transcript_20015:69-632(+)
MPKQALLVCDFQRMMLSRVPKEQGEAILANTAKVLAASRKKGILVVHVVVAFRKGHPEISPSNALFSKIQQNNLMQFGNQETEEHETIRSDDEPVVAKKRVSPFGTTDIQAILRSQGIEELVLAGISTSGVILSTGLEAFDLDYKVTVLEDCCADTDQEVHAVLTKKVFVNRGFTVQSADDYVKTLA